jgi:hypothetical protein
MVVFWQTSTSPIDAERKLRRQLRKDNEGSPSRHRFQKHSPSTKMTRKTRNQESLRTGDL